jgi:hypothetical protein
MRLFRRLLHKDLWSSNIKMLKAISVVIVEQRCFLIFYFSVYHSRWYFLFYYFSFLNVSYSFVQPSVLWYWRLPVRAETCREVLRNKEVVSCICGPNIYNFIQYMQVTQQAAPLKDKRGNVVVKTLCYKPEDRGFDTQWGECLNLPNPFCRTRPWGLLSL